MSVARCSKENLLTIVVDLFICGIHGERPIAMSAVSMSKVPRWIL